MSKLKIIYILALVLLGVLLVFTVFKPMAIGGEYSEVSREQLLQTEDKWIIQFDIMNHEGEEQNYTINIRVDGKPSTLTVSIKDKGVFTYIHHLYKDQITKGEVTLAMYKEGEDSPIKQVSYYLK